MDSENIQLMLSGKLYKLKKARYPTVVDERYIYLEAV